MPDDTGWLKKSLEDAIKAVEGWPEWKKLLESATTESQFMNSSTSVSSIEAARADSVQLSQKSDGP